MSQTVSTINMDYAAHANQWELMRDVLDVDQIKAKGVKYLPQPDPENTSDANKKRYEDYKQRAQFLGVTGRTIESLVGAIYRRAPQIELPANLQYMIENCDGQGNSLEQFSKHICTEGLIVGRGGILADYPQADEGLSAEDVLRLGLSARMAYYPTESIINWRTRIVSSQTLLDMVVLSEVQPNWKDDFSYTQEQRYRVLIMREGVYSQELYDSNGDLISQFFPRNSSGALWAEIPFKFFGAKDNSTNIAVPPLYSLANLNIGWYRNSADLEESAFICGQPTLFITSDMSATDFTTANPNGISIGSRKGHLLGATGSAVMLQASENNLASQGMKDKEAQMLQIGARLVGEKAQNETAQAARIRAGAEVSALTSLVTNASEAIEQALIWCGEFMGAPFAELEFQLNTQFFDDDLDPQTIAQLMGLVESRHISQADLRNKLRSGGMLDPSRTDKEIDADIDKEGLVLGGDETDADNDRV